MTPTGAELARQYSSFGDAPECAAEISALGPDSDRIDPALAEIIDAWPTLPKAVLADITAIVRKSHKIS